jgi:DNA-binding CsgD family transcriptional regulator
MATVCRELSTQFDGAMVGVVDHGGGFVNAVPYEAHADIDVDFYVQHIDHHPLVRHMVETGDAAPAHLADAHRFRADPRAERLVRRSFDDGLREQLVIPLRPRPGMNHRWLGAAGESEPTRRHLGLCRALAGLLWAIDAQQLMLQPWSSAVKDPALAARVGLTAREVAVLALVADGLTAHAIARQLGISARTVAKHQENIYRKLDVGDRLSAVLAAQHHGLLPRAVTRAKSVKQRRSPEPIGAAT